MFDKILEIYHIKKWTIIVISFSILILWAAVSSLLPQVIRIVHINSEIKNNNKRIRQADEWGKTVVHLKKENKKLVQLLEKIHVQAPQDDELSYILSFLSESAEKTKVKFISIKPQEVEISSGYRTIPILLELNCTFHNVARFLNLIETSKNVVNIEQLEVKTKGLLSANLKVKIKMAVMYLIKS